mmetsp:Transcript_19527/g.55989  ORF Transcript_19527/g.55989 Transcript_19527/m.55989 type:complete len:179 (+) Transcript_19527:163-699(+)
MKLLLCLVGALLLAGAVCADPFPTAAATAVDASADAGIAPPMPTRFLASREATPLDDDDEGKELTELPLHAEVDGEDEERRRLGLGVPVQRHVRTEHFEHRGVNNCHRTRWLLDQAKARGRAIARQWSSSCRACVWRLTRVGLAGPVHKQFGTKPWPSNARWCKLTGNVKMYFAKYHI